MANGKAGLAGQMERRPEAPERLPKMFESVESRNGRSDEGLDRGWPRSATPSSSAGRSLRWCTPTAGPIRAKKFVRVLRTNGSSDRWAAPGPAPTTPPWSRSSHCYRRTSWTASTGRQERSSVWPSCTGSRGPITAGVASGLSASSPPSSSQQCMRSPMRPRVFQPRESTEVGAVPSPQSPHERFRRSLSHGSPRLQRSSIVGASPSKYSGEFSSGPTRNNASRSANT